jgi:prolyl-tRNA synthetase
MKEPARGFARTHACAGGSAGGSEKRKETKLGLSAKKGEDFGSWYSEVVVESEMISYYDVSGAALLPWLCQPCCLPTTLPAVC